VTDRQLEPTDSELRLRQVSVTEYILELLRLLKISRVIGLVQSDVGLRRAGTTSILFAR
jgi:hypothetical protein